MDAALIDRIESNVERIASAIFAGAVCYAAYGLLGRVLTQTQLVSCAAVAGAVAFVVCNGVLGALTPRKPRFAVPLFDVRHIDTDELLLTKTDRIGLNELILTATDRRVEDELLLTDSDRLDDGSAKTNPLVLDDILAEIGSDARVVRLFDRKAMPTPGQLKSRIDHHIEQEASRSGTSDASQALSDALAELRRSLR